MSVFLSQFILDNRHRLEGTCLITVNGVTFVDRIKFSVEITGYCTVYGVSNGSMQNPKIWWGDFDPEGVFDDIPAARNAVNRALKKAIPRLTPAGKDASFWEQGVSNWECERLQEELANERVEVVL